MRARNIKPAFFQNELLAQCDPLARILFAALWGMADREGRLEDRPARIKAMGLPYDQADVDALLGQLAKHGFITRYQVGDIKVIQVVNFTKHQSPHSREPVSELPLMEKPGLGRAEARPNSGQARPRLSCDSGHVPLNPESPILNPESGKLNPGEFNLSPPGLAQRFVFKQTRKPKDPEYDVASWITGVLVRVPPEQVSAEIDRESRHTNESIREFCRRLDPPEFVKNGKAKTFTEKMAEAKKRFDTS